jgi:opacity protein-like surface antigen
MNKRIPLIALTLIVLGTEPLSAQGLKGRELLGLRIGGTIASSALHDEFGNGTELELHFIKGITTWFGADVSLSSHNFGESQNAAKNIEFTGLNREVDLQIYSLTVGLIMLKPLREHVTPTIEAGPGLYSVNTILREGFSEAQKTDNRFGLYGGVGLLMAITKSISLNVNAKYHHVFVGDSNEDTIHFYTGEQTARFYQVAVGVAIYTG